MIVKIVNEITGFNGLVPILLLFGAYSQISVLDPPAYSFTQQTDTMKHVMDKIWKIAVQHQVADAHNTRNILLINYFHNLSLNTDVLVWKNDNAGRTGLWTGHFSFLNIEDKTCKIDLTSGLTEF